MKLTKDPIFILLPKNLSKWYEYCFKKFIKEQFNTEDYSKYLKVIYNPETITTKESKSIWSRSKSETKDVEKIEKVESDKDVLNKILKENNLELIIR